MPLPRLLVALDADARTRQIVSQGVGDIAEISYLSDLGDNGRREALASVAVVLSRNTAKELRPGEADCLGQARLIQFVTAGVDYIPLADLPAAIPIAANGGAYSEPMAEHALAMALAAYKRLFVEHAKLAVGTFDQFAPNRMLAGATVGILGFGSIGVATARVMRALGAKVHAVNRRGTTDEHVDWIGTTSDTDHLLRQSDILVLCLPLTPSSRNMIGARELGLMKADAVLINLARGEIIDEAAFFAHLEANPRFTACIDAWWVEPVRHGAFRMDHDFMRLPNVIASPHNSASVHGWRDVATTRAVANARRALLGEAPRFLVPPEDRMM